MRRVFQKFPIMTTFRENHLPDKRGKKFWGERFWDVFHEMCAVYQPQNAHHFKQMITAFPYLLPCGSCGEHFRKNLQTFPPDAYMRNNHELFFWSYVIHDVVNKQINEENSKRGSTIDAAPKISPPFEVVKRYYFVGLGTECKVCSL